MKRRTLKDVQGNGLPHHQNPPRIPKGATLEREAQPIASPAPRPNMLDVVVGQRVMAQQGGFVRGQVEQRRALARAPDASSRHVPPLRYPFIPPCAALSVRGRPADGAVRHPDPRQTGTRSVSYEWYGNNCGCGTLSAHFPHDGYARCSTDRQELATQRQALLALGVAEDRIYTDHGLTGTTRARLGLEQALTAVRAGDTLVVPKLDRLARSVPDARAIADQLLERGVKLALGRALYDPDDPMGKMFFNILATFAEFEADLIRMRTREGMAIVRAKGKLRGKQPKLSDQQQRELCRMHVTGEYSISDLAELFSVSRPTVYRTLNRRLSP